jgi:thiol-disulfide isomerase/thioredoxin
MKRVEESKELAKAVKGKKAVVLVHATWCPFCRSFLPVFQKATEGAGLEVIEAVVDDEENPIWNEQDVDVVPTVLFFEGGKVVKRLDGRAGVGLTREDIEGAMAKA